MNEALLELKNKIASFRIFDTISLPNNPSKDKFVVVFMAGGLSSRFTEVSSSQKSSFTLPNGDTMIEMALKMYQEAGFKRFAVLVSYQAQDIIDLLGDGSKYGVTITYSHDPSGSPIGKGGALRNALDNSTFLKDSYLIIHNPDDVIVDFQNFPEYIFQNFLKAESVGYDGMVVVVSETPYEFSGMMIQNGEVTGIEMYPMVPIPAHVGVTVLGPKVLNYFTELFNYETKSDFEKVLFPILTREKKLFALEIPKDSWIAVNNLKSYNKLIKKIS